MSRNLPCRVTPSTSVPLSADSGGSKVFSALNAAMSTRTMARSGEPAAQVQREAFDLGKLGHAVSLGERPSGRALLAEAPRSSRSVPKTRSSRPRCCSYAVCSPPRSTSIRSGTSVIGSRKVPAHVPARHSDSTTRSASGCHETRRARPSPRWSRNTSPVDGSGDGRSMVTFWSRRRAVSALSG